MEVFKNIFRDFTAPYLKNTGNGKLNDFQLNLIIRMMFMKTAKKFAAA